MSYKPLSTLVLVLAIALLILAACGAPTPTAAPTTAPTVTATTTKTLVLSDISDNPAKRIEAFQPLADYLGANLSAFGIGAATVKIAPDFDTLIKWMRAGDVDIYFDSPFPALVLMNQAGAQVILRRWRDGQSEYYTVFFVRKDSGITSVADLKGRMVAFKEPYSSSGYFLPKAYLIQANMNPVEKASTDAEVGKDDVGYVFSKGDENTIQWVISGKTAAGAVDNISFDKIPDQSRSALVILAKTDAVYRQVAVVRSGMDPKMIEAIETLLMALDKTPDGQAILKKFQETTKFDKLPGGPEVAFARVRELYDLVEKQKR